METDQLRIALDTLRVEEAEGARRLEQLKLELWAVEQRQESVRTAISGLSAILGETPTNVFSARGSRPDYSLRPTSINSDAIDSSEASDVTEEEVPRVRRIPSAKWLAEIVDDLNRVLTRAELFDAYEERHGFAPTWKNPRNVLGTALGRAVERGQILGLSGDRYAPISHTTSDFQEPDSTEEGSDG